MFFEYRFIMKEMAIVLVLALSLTAVPLSAKPAPWYLWQSKLDGHYICIQASAGEGWKKVAGPYTTAQCHRYLKQLLIDPGLLNGKSKLFLKSFDD